MSDSIVNLVQSTLGGFHNLQLRMEDVELALREMDAAEVAKAEAAVVEGRVLPDHFGRDFFEQLANVAEAKGLEKTALLYRRCRSLIGPTIVDHATEMQSSIEGLLSRFDILIHGMEASLQAGLDVESFMNSLAAVSSQVLHAFAERADQLECRRMAALLRQIIKSRNE